jgi:hypothetical protein
LIKYVAFWDDSVMLAFSLMHSKAEKCPILDQGMLKHKENKIGPHQLFEGML